MHRSWRVSLQLVPLASRFENLYFNVFSVSGTRKNDSAIFVQQKAFASCYDTVVGKYGSMFSKSV